MTRAMRRHHRERIKRARRHYWDNYSGLNQRELGIAVDTPKQCSCFMCGHRRKHSGETMQERRASILEHGNLGQAVWND